MTSTLSVIVPAYDAEKYLGTCAVSILNQLSDGDKLIIVDDNSSDGTKQIALKIAEENPGRVDVLDGGGQGVSHARNVGFQAVETDYVAFCDADDTFLDTALTQLRKILDDKHDIDIVVGNYCRDNQQRCNISQYEITSSYSALLRTLYQHPGWHESAWAKIYRRKVLNKLDGIFIENRRYEDLEATARIYLSATKIAITPASVYWYRPNPHSFINTWSKSRLDALWAVDQILATVARDNNLVAAANSRRLSANFNILAIAHNAGEKEIVKSCLLTIKSLRKQVLCDKNCRIRNRVAAAISYLGPCATLSFARLHEKLKS